MVLKRIVTGFIVAVAVAGCGGGFSLSDYAEEVEVMVTTMNSHLDRLEADLGEDPDLEAIKAYAEARVEARRDFIAGMRSLEPPDSVVDLHAEALEIVGDLTESEAILAAAVADATSLSGLGDIWESPEGIAARAADARAILLCEAAQDSFDQSESLEEFEDVPWVPNEVKRVIRVVLGCNAADR